MMIQWLVLFGLGLFFSAGGFFRLVYFISVGYGYSIAGMAAFLLVWNFPSLALVDMALAVLLILYGVRLGTYVWLREFQKGYATVRQEASREYGGRNLPRALVIWIGVSLLYVIMVSPLTFRATAALADLGFWGWAGFAVGTLGLLLETAADAQKAAFKKKHPDQFCGNGLFRLVRNPNYLGEMLVWKGVWLSGIPFYRNWWMWVVATSGLVIIILIMLGSARRLEIKQEARYGEDPFWQTYRAKTPVVFPFVPLHSLKGLKVYLG